MKNFILCLSLFILVCSCGTPKVVEKPKSDINIQKAPSELAVQYKKLTNSVSYLKFEKINDQFLEDMNFNEGKANFTDEKSILEWLSKNVASTSFKDYDDAVLHYNAYKAAYNEYYNENKAYFKAYLDASPEDQLKYPPI